MLYISLKTFCQRLSENTKFILYLRPDPFDFTLAASFSISKASYAVISDICSNWDLTNN